MELKEAKGIIFDYIYYSLKTDISILGRKHEFVESTLLEIEDAFEILNKNSVFD